MNAPATVEGNLLKQAESHIAGCVARYDMDAGEGRFRLLEAASAGIGGYDPGRFREAFAIADNGHEDAVTMDAGRLVSMLAQTGIHPVLCLSVLARENLDRGSRRKSGAYHTDFRLAGHLAESMRPHVRKGARVLDPACGAGMLLAAVSLVACGGSGISTDAWLRESVYAADISPAALRGTRLVLGAMTDDVGTIEAMTARWHCHDSLLAHEDVWKGGPADGFDIVVANPPWERVKLTRHEHARNMGGAGNYGDEHDGAALEGYEAAKSSMAVLGGALAGRYPLLGKGEPDLYVAFAELLYRVTRPGGRGVLLVPAGLIRSRNTEALRRAFVEGSDELTITIMDNTARHFAIDTRFKFLVVNYRRRVDAGGEGRDVAGRVGFGKGGAGEVESGRGVSAVGGAGMDMSGKVQSAQGELGRGELGIGGTDESASGKSESGKGALRSIGLAHATSDDGAVRASPAVALPLRTLARMRPDLTLPEVRSGAEWRLFRKMQASGSSPVEPDTPWRQKFCREVDMTHGRRHFVDSPGEGCLPVIEGRMVQPHRLGCKTYEAGRGRGAVWRNLSPGSSRVAPQFWMPGEELSVEALRRSGLPRVGFCDITGQTNERSMMASYIPPGVVCGNKVPTVMFPNDRSDSRLYLWLAVVNSIPFDWMLRRVVTTTINYFVLLSLSLPVFGRVIHCSPDRRRGRCRTGLRGFRSNTGCRRVRAPCTALTCAGERAPGLGWQIAQCRAEIDVIVARAYGCTRGDLEIMLNDFPLLDRGQPALAGEAASTVTRDTLLLMWHRTQGEGSMKDDRALAGRVERARELGAMAYVSSEFAGVAGSGSGVGNAGVGRAGTG